MGIRTLALISASVVAFALPGAAGAATQLGQLKPAADMPSPCSGNRDFVQTSTAPGVSYSVPTYGVITGWQHFATIFGGSGRLQVWRGNPAEPLFSLVGRSDIEAFTPNAVSSFQTRIPVAAGDLIGMRVSTSASCIFDAPGAGTNDVIASEPVFPVPDPSPGETANLGASAPDARVNIAATFEADSDGDGFGDESQDCNPASAALTTDCAPPDTTITKGPKKKTRKKRATFEIAGTDARAVAGFECLLDGAAFAPCSSPLEVKVKKGKHTFSVRATDDAGNVDPTPATLRWKVRKKEH